MKNIVLSICLFCMFIFTFILIIENRHNFQTSNKIQKVSNKIYVTLNQSVKSNKNLRFKITPIGHKESKIVYASVLELSKNWSKDSLYCKIEYLDTTFYLVSCSNYY